MADPAPPSDAELDVLKCFWRDGPLSAREVQDRIRNRLDWTPSTTRTVLERMRAKGLLSRRAVHGVAVYAAAQPKVAVIGGLMKRLSELLDLDGPLPAAAFSGSQILDAEDIAALEAVLAADGTSPDGEGA
ncbi:MAG TPA: BlaI/MecI/CopY family transcriptional regulator [Brevundimonas sp.]|jgi:predicted transcriptional regulator|uniref:BlaI/MecI/CopY family transcriptional regulator n=1 Tax=Brevundimonas sp. TaxID=1871086 RepID=UPI002E0D8856|nr:BlaI/MecI/CopY family transcriptional regulator [Brevundimonas sp.]